jgi:predicted ATP-grasp superfamily ATP-dependent carboligase
MKGNHVANYLLTGARAPVTLELARNLHRFGHQVFVTDSLNYPLTKNTRAIAGYHRISPPRNHLDAYATDLIALIVKCNIAYLLPTCEEVFYIAKIKDRLEEHCTVLCPDFKLIAKLHSKFDILKLASDCGIAVPHSRWLNQSELLAHHAFENQIVKCEFCRFGTDVLVHPDKRSVKRLANRTPGPYLLQEKITGKEFCTYGVAHQGKLQLHVCYEPVYRVAGSASIYFKQVSHPCITQFTRHFVEQYNYTGQIGFDWIDQGDQTYLIECNPRATSGVHLVTEADIHACCTGQQTHLDVENPTPAMIGPAMMWSQVPHAILKGKWLETCRDYRLARDVIKLRGDKRFALFHLLSLVELACLAWQKRITIRAATTHDIQWDGEAL